jgi:hypothetical protein
LTASLVVCACMCIWRARVDVVKRRQLELISGLKGQETERGDKCACIGL